MSSEARVAWPVDSSALARRVAGPNKGLAPECAGPSLFTSELAAVCGARYDFVMETIKTESERERDELAEFHSRLSSERESLVGFRSRLREVLAAVPQDGGELGYYELLEKALSAFGLEAGVTLRRLGERGSSRGEPDNMSDDDLLKLRDSLDALKRLLP